AQLCAQPLLSHARKANLPLGRLSYAGSGASMESELAESDDLPSVPIIRHRTLFLSDIHLGTRASQTLALLDFLKHNDADMIYLVGDIVDFWRVKRGPVWPQSHNDVLQKLMRKVRKGTRLVYIPGNHDEGLRDYAGAHFGGIEIARQCVHATA